MTTTTLAEVTTPFRQLRLSHGWELADLAMRMKFTATVRGLVLPPVGLLVAWLFLWENQRQPIPGFYADLLTVVFDTYPCPRTVTL